MQIRTLPTQITVTAPATANIVSTEAVGANRMIDSQVAAAGTPAIIGRANVIDMEMIAQDLRAIKNGLRDTPATKVSLIDLMEMETDVGTDHHQPESDPTITRKN